MSAAAVPLPAPATRRIPRTALLVRLAAVGALAFFCALQWGTLLAPAAGGKMLLAVLLGAAAAAAIVFVPRAKWVVVAVTAVATVPLGLLIAGASTAQIAPSGWGGLTRGIADALTVLPGINIPYAGVDPFVRLTILAGGAALIVLAFVVAAAAPRRGRAIALVALIVAYAVPATETSATSPYLRGAVFAVLVGAVLWGERLAGAGGTSSASQAPWPPRCSLSAPSPASPLAPASTSTSRGWTGTRWSPTCPAAPPSSSLGPHVRPVRLAPGRPRGDARQVRAPGVLEGREPRRLRRAPLGPGRAPAR